MAETVRNSVNRAMGRPEEEVPKRESMRESIVRAIADLNEALANHDREAAEKEKEKGPEPQYEKDEVNYRDGDVREHCGKCSHFQVLKQNGCELVKGFIEAKKMCDEYEAEDEYA